MAISFLPQGFSGDAPPGYETPTWPSLYWLGSDDGAFLFYTEDIWLFTLYWTLLLQGLTFFVAGMWAYLVLAKRRPLISAIVPVYFVLIALITGFLSATVVGFALAAIYGSANFHMSTWVPALWALSIVLVLVIGSYSSVATIL